MKKVLIAFLLLCLPLFLIAQDERTRPATTGDRGIDFIEALNWQQVLEKASVGNEYIFVDLWATWCVPCIQMEKEVYPNDTVGYYLNSRFISIKVQTDETPKDNEYVKRWHPEARRLSRQYGVNAVPTFLFFNPQGKLTFKDDGYKNVQDFIKMAEKALDPQNLLYYSGLEDYKNESLDLEAMYELAVRARSLGNDSIARTIATDYINRRERKQLLEKDKILFVLNVAWNRKLADSLAKEYKRNVLDNLSEDELCTKENLNFTAMFSRLIRTDDKLFQLFYHQPERVNQIMSPLWTQGVVHQAITREEMEEKLWKADKPVVKHPDWKSIQSNISKKYGKVDAEKLVLNYQVGYYLRIKDWTNWAKHKGQRITKYPPNPAGLEVYFELNRSGAWYAFLNCNDTKVLATALEWIDLAIEKDSETKANLLHNYLDTKANLLYKLGKVHEAIAQEKKAVEIALARSKQEGTNAGALVKEANDFTLVIAQMENGEPTYLGEGAVWDAKSLKRIRRTKPN